jgi:hypothetical protein
MLAKVLFAAVAEPNFELFGDFGLLYFTELCIQQEGFLALAPAGSVVVGFPVGHGNANAAIGFFDQGFAFEGLIGFWGGHACSLGLPLGLYSSGLSESRGGCLSLNQKCYPGVRVLFVLFF